MSEKTTGKKKNKRRSIVRKMWTWFAILVGLLVLMFVLIYNGVIGYMPPIDQLKNPTDKFASTIYSADGVEMGRYYRSRSNRIYVDFDEMSPHLTDALIATEDSRFDEHSGVDVKAIGRAIIKRIIMGQKSAGGGSTITQQLAKQLYSPESHNIFERALKKPVDPDLLHAMQALYQLSYNPKDAHKYRMNSCTCQGQGTKKMKFFRCRLMLFLWSRIR